MAGLGDYGRFQQAYASKTTDFTATTATTTTAAVISPKSANHQLYIQKIAVSITTYSAKTITFQDSAGTPVPIGLISVAAAAEAHASESGTIVIDFGQRGYPLTTGKTLDVVLSGAGAAFVAHIEAYERLVGPVAVGSTI